MQTVRLFHWRASDPEVFIASLPAAVGLVDYKICPLDGLWSEMSFAVKKIKK